MADKKNTSNSPRKGGPERRIVQPSPEGGYEVIKPHHERASAKAPTEKQAYERAKEIVTNLGGGEVTIKDQKGHIKNSNTVGGGNDPNPPKDKKH